MMRLLIARAAAAVAGLMLLSGAAVAQVVTGSEAQALVQQAAARLGAIETFAAAFRMMTPNGINTGAIYIDRGREAMRMEFAEPLGHLVIVNGPMTQFYGGDGTQVQIATSGTPLAFLLAPEKALREDLEILQVEKRRNSLYVAVAERGNREAGQVLLHFAGEGEWQLQDWGTFTPNGGYVQTTLSDIQVGRELDRNLFRVPE